MAKTAQILLLLLVAVAVQSYGGRRYFRGRSHRHRNPNDYSHHRGHDEVHRPRDDRHDRYPNRHHHSSHNPGDSLAVLGNPAVPDGRPQYSPHAEGSVSVFEQPSLVDSVPDNNSTPSDNGSSESDDLVPDQGVDLTGAVDNDKPDDVANVIESGNNLDEEPDQTGDNNSGDASSSGENPENTINVDELPPNGSNEQPEGDRPIIINGLSPGNVDDDLHGNVGGNFDGKIDGSQPSLDKPTGSINVNDLEPGENDGSPSTKSPNDDYDDGYSVLPEDKNESGHNGNDIYDNKLLPNGGDNYINVNGLSPEDINEHHDGSDSVHDGDDDDHSGHGSINVNGLSPVGDVSKVDNNNINSNGFSPGGDDADGHGNEHGRLPSVHLGKPNHNDIDAHGLENDHNRHRDHAVHQPDNSYLNNGELPSGAGSVGVAGDLPFLSGHINSGGLPAEPKPSEHFIDHGGLEGNTNPRVSEHPTFPGDDIIPNPGHYMLPRPGIGEKPDEIAPLEIPGQLDNNGGGTKNNSMMIPVLLPGGGHILVSASGLGNIPSYIIVMINGQPTLIQNPGGIGIGGGNNGFSIGGISGGAVLPSWLAGIGNGGASIGGGGIGILPNNVQPIWIGSQLPNFGGGGVSGQYIIPTTAPIQPVPVQPVPVQPVPIPRPLPPPRPIYPVPQPIPMPGPGLNINTYPGFPWPSTWNPSNPGNVNVNLTHNLLPVQGSDIDWNTLLDLLANIDSRLPKPQPLHPKPLPMPNYPSYPYPQYPYPPPYPYPPYPYPPNYLYPDNKKPMDPSYLQPDGPGSPGQHPLEPIVPGPEEGPHEPMVPGPGERPHEPIVPGPGEGPHEPIVPGPGEGPHEPIVPGPGERPHEPIVPGPGEGPHEPIVPGPGERPHEPIVPGPGERPHEPIVPGPGESPYEPIVPGPGEGPHEPIVPGPGKRPHEPIVPGPGERPYEPIVPGPGEGPHEPIVPGPGEGPHEPIVPGPGEGPEEHKVPGSELPPHNIIPVDKERDPADVSRYPNPDVTSPPLVPNEPTVPRPSEPTHNEPSIPRPYEPTTNEPNVPRPDEPKPNEPTVPKPYEPTPNEPNVPRPDEQKPNEPTVPRPYEPTPNEPNMPRPDEPKLNEPTVPRPDEPKPKEPSLSKPEEPTVPKPTVPKPHPGHPDHHHHDPDNTIINLPDIHITLPKPNYNGKPKPSHPGPDSGLIDILNVLLKFPDRNSHPPKNLGPLIKLLLAILKPGEKNQVNIPSLNEDVKGQPNLGNLLHLLLHLSDDHNKEPNFNVLVEPGMDESTRANLILLLQMLANNLGAGSYPSMGYYQPENPLLYFLGHFPCDHPSFPAISGMQSGSNLWQLLANMYGHNYGQELRLGRSAEETDGDDKAIEATEKTDTK